MKIYLIRHGETTGDVEDRYGGDYDDDLSPNGEAQVKGMAKKLVDSDIEVIYHSPLVRAAQTAQVLGAFVGAPLIQMEDLRERNNYGELTGMTKKEAAEQFPEEVEELEGNPIYHKIPNSEEYFEFAERVINAFNKIAEGEQEVVAIVTHGGPIRTIFRELIGFEIEGLADCSVIELEKDEDGTEIIGMDGIGSITPN